MSGADNPLGSGTIWSPRPGRMNSRMGGVGHGAGGPFIRGGAGGRGRGMNPAQREAMQRRLAASRTQNLAPEEQQQMMQMQQARGRGRAIRGGRGGRGQPQQQNQQRIKRTSYLEFFTPNEWTKLKIMSCLTEDERKLLGSVYPMFKPRELTPQQKKMMEERQKKVALAKKEQEERKAAMAAKAAEYAAKALPSDEEKKMLADEEKTLAEEEKRISEEEKKLAQEDVEAGDIILLREIRNFKDGTEVPETDDITDGVKDAETGKEVLEDGNKAEEAINDEKKNVEIAATRTAHMEMLKANRKQHEAALAANLTDPHTLLARLNTKRLYRRIRYLQKKDKHCDLTKVYPLNKTTEQIAITEWQDILNEYTERQKKLWKERQEKEAEERRLVSDVEDAENPVAKGTTIEDNKVSEDTEAMQNKDVVVTVGDSLGGTNLVSVEKPLEHVPLQSPGNPLGEPNSKDANDANEDDKLVEKLKEKEETTELDETKTSEEVKGRSKDEKDEIGGREVVRPNILSLPSKCELLMFSPCPRAVAVLASYPRSGNSLLRTLYERSTLRVSGSDMRGGLQKHDLVGEAATQTNCVQFVKTHYPERMGAPPLRVDRAVLLVRNPYDAMESYFNLMTTNTHTSSLSEEDRKKYGEIFANMARKEILVWRDFHEYWLSQKIPLLVIRYEDLIRYTDKVIAKVIRFVLEVKSMKFFEERIDRCIREEQIEKLGSYKPRSGGIGKSLTKGVYSPKLLSDINCGIMNTMEKFGYTEMLVPNPSEWELEPLDQLGVEIIPSERQPLVINQRGLVRNAQSNTDWRAVKQQMEMKQDQ